MLLAIVLSIPAAGFLLARSTTFTVRLMVIILRRRRAGGWLPEFGWNSTLNQALCQVV
jgi:hypothetical protein